MPDSLNGILDTKHLPGQCELCLSVGELLGHVTSPISPVVSVTTVTTSTSPLLTQQMTTITGDTRKHSPLHVGKYSQLIILCNLPLDGVIANLQTFGDQILFFYKNKKYKLILTEKHGYFNSLSLFCVTLYKLIIPVKVKLTRTYNIFLLTVYLHTEIVT